MKMKLLFASIFAALCLLFLACPNPSEPQPALPPPPLIPSFSRDALEDTGDIITLQWWSYYTTNAYTVFDGSWGGNSAAVALAALPSGSYLRVEFEGIMSVNWPEEAHDGKDLVRFKDQFITFGVRGGDKAKYPITLEGLGKVNYDGEGEAFIGVDRLQEIMMENPVVAYQTYYELGYGGNSYLYPGDMYNPWMIARAGSDYDGTPIDFAFLDLGVWIPREPLAAKKAVLQTAIASAQKFLNSTPRSFTGGKELEYLKPFALQDDCESFEAAIEAAKTVYYDKNVKQSAVNVAARKVKEASDIFESKTQMAVGDSPHFTDDYRYSGKITMNWWGGTGAPNAYMAFNWTDQDAGRQISRLPAGSYLRVVFEGLGSTWPTQINKSGGGKANFEDEFIYFIADNTNNPAYEPITEPPDHVAVIISELGVIAGGKGEAFIAVDPIKEVIEANEDEGFSYPYYNYYTFGYGYGTKLIPGAFGNPKMITRNGDFLDLEVWLPKQE
jgi:hypothetical protein